MYRFLPLFALAAMPAIAQDKPPAPTDEGTIGKTVVVTGVRLSDLRDALAKCIARKCPPDQDVAASTALAEQEFVEGKYGDARSTLKASLGRNKRFAKGYPLPVSNLLRANSRIAAHVGAGDEYRIETLAVVSALKAGFGPNDPRVLAADVEVGDMFARFGEIEGAVQKYRATADAATKANLPYIRGMARLRIVALYAQLADKDKQGYLAYFQAARGAAEDLAKDPDPRMKAFATAGKLIVARLSAKRGDPAALDAMVAAYAAAAGSTTRPVLLYLPPMKALDPLYDGSLPATIWTKINSGDLIGQWADIGFWVKPDGTVDDVQVLRGGVGLVVGPRKANAKFDDAWTIPIVRQIAGRRYAPMTTADPNSPGALRVERYTMTAWLTDGLAPNGKGSRIQISGKPRYEMLDLSVDPPAPSGK